MVESSEHDHRPNAIKSGEVEGRERETGWDRFQKTIIPVQNI